MVVIGTLLTVKEVAELKGCSERHIRNLVSTGKLKAVEDVNPSNRQKQYLIDTADLPAPLQKRYYAALKAQGPLPAAVTPAPIRQKPFDQYTADERKQITFWTDIIEEWLEHRKGFERMTDADPLFVAALKLRHKGLDISVDTLYRRYAAYKAGDLDGLVDKRGGWNRGQSAIPEEVWNYFLYAYLDDRQLPISQCYALCKQWTAEFAPELMPAIPSEQSFRRRASRIEESVVTLGRQGAKHYDDRCGPYITRLYDELRANDYWIADNHTLDILSRAEDGSESIHRLSLTAFIDARSGVMTGWNLTDNPCSQSTLLALRNGILRFGIPRKLYVDNGREFLTHDIGGTGHRTKKSQSLIEDPPPVFKRLGIEMTNAIVRNAKAKPIERTFGSLKGTISRCFETFTGGTVLEKPESLKYTLKKGEVPLDSRLREIISDMIDGVYNAGAYGGAVKSDQGKSRIDVWNESIAEAGQRMAPAEDLALMLMRSTRVQKVGRNGVYITVCGERLEYWDTETQLMQGKEVYVRYDPENLATVRIYDAGTDAYINTVPMAMNTTLLFDDTPDAVKIAQETIRTAKRAVKGRLQEYRTQLPAARRIDILDMQVRRAQSGKAGMIIQAPKIIIPVSAGEEPLKKVSGGNIEGVVIDMTRMNTNAARRGKNM
ncbi:MAG: helix-turn-helix domain-containing protein [Clostridia bacterium]|nr:helix-turn-helix domain-containing protein [Clostridia bacterium]